MDRTISMKLQVWPYPWKLVGYLRCFLKNKLFLLFIYYQTYILGEKKSDKTTEIPFLILQIYAQNLSTKNP